MPMFGLCRPVGVHAGQRRGRALGVGIVDWRDASSDREEAVVGDVHRECEGPLAGWIGPLASWLVFAGCAPGRVRRTVLAFGRLSSWLAKRFLALHQLVVLHGPSRRDRGGMPRLPAGPLAEVVVDLVAWLRAEGYAPGTATSITCTAARLGAWMAGARLRIE